MLAAFLSYLLIGTEPIAISKVLSALLHGPPTGHDPESFIIWMIRLPRALACLLVGAVLGTVGSAFQSLFRNPLSDPYIIGVASGASVGGTTAILFGIDFGLARVGLAGVGARLILWLVLVVSGW